MDESEMKEFADNILHHYYRHGWNKTLKLIKQIQQKEGDAAKQLLKRIEDRIAGSQDGDLIYFYAKDVKGANLSNLKFALMQEIDRECYSNCHYDSNGEFYEPGETSKSKRWKKYLKIIEKMIPPKIIIHVPSTEEMKDLIDKL